MIQPDVVENAIKHEMKDADQTVFRFDAAATAAPRVGVLCLPGYRIFNRVCSQSPHHCRPTTCVCVCVW